MRILFRCPNSNLLLCVSCSDHSKVFHFREARLPGDTRWTMDSVIPLSATLFELEKNNKVNWAPFIQGIEACWLYRPETSGSQAAAVHWAAVKEGEQTSSVCQFDDAQSFVTSAAFLKFSPGAKFGIHWHCGYEQVVCCEGTFEDETVTYKVVSNQDVVE